MKILLKRKKKSKEKHGKTRLHQIYDKITPQIGKKYLFCSMKNRFMLISQVESSSNISSFPPFDDSGNLFFHVTMMQAKGR